VSQKLYVGNLPFNTTEDQLKEHFSKYGEVSSVIIVKDRDTQRSRGFGFVEMYEISTALNEANGSTLGGRSLTVSLAREREKSSNNLKRH
jgi:RNA recognition motif-containing protein